MRSKAKLVLAGFILLAFTVSWASADTVVGYNKITAKFVTDAVNATGSKVVSVAPGEMINVSFVYENNTFYVIDFLGIHVGMARPLKGTFKGDIRDLYIAAHNVSSDGDIWPHVVFHIESDGSLLIKSVYDYQEQISQEDFIHYLKWVMTFAKSGYSEEPQFTKAYGNWSS